MDPTDSLLARADERIAASRLSRPRLLDPTDSLLAEADSVIASKPKPADTTDSLLAEADARIIRPGREFKKAIGKAVLGAGRAASSALEGITTAAKSTADFLGLESQDSQRFGIVDALQAGATEARKFYEQPRPALDRAPGIDWKSRPLLRAGLAAAEALPQFIAGAAASIAAKSPAPMMALYGTTAYGDTYASAKAAGVSEPRAQTTALLNAAWNTISERFGFGALLEAPKRTILRNIAAGATRESIQESIQQLGQNAIEKYGFDPGREYWDGLADAAAGAFLLGGGGGAFVPRARPGAPAAAPAPAPSANDWMRVPPATGAQAPAAAPVVPVTGTHAAPVVPVAGTPPAPLVPVNPVDRNAGLFQAPVLAGAQPIVLPPAPEPVAPVDRSAGLFQPPVLDGAPPLAIPPAPPAAVVAPPAPAAPAPAPVQPPAAPAPQQAAPVAPPAPAAPSPAPTPQPTASEPKSAKDEYFDALFRSSELSRAFEAVQRDYRDRKIGDEEFLRARRQLDEAQAAFDKAEARYVASLPAEETRATPRVESSQPAADSAATPVPGVPTPEPAVSNDTRPSSDKAKLVPSRRPDGGIRIDAVPVQPPKPFNITPMETPADASGLTKVANRQEAEALFSDGKTLYGADEMENGLTEITTLEMLHGYPPDAIYYDPAASTPNPEQSSIPTGAPDETNPSGRANDLVAQRPQGPGTQPADAVEPPAAQPAGTDRVSGPEAAGGGGRRARSPGARRGRDGGGGTQDGGVEPAGRGAGGRDAQSGGQAAAGEVQSRELTPAAPKGENHRIEDGDTLIVGGDKSKAKANIRALELLKELEDQNRLPTLEERRELARYVGWGGLPQVFDDGKMRWNEDFRRQWGKEVERVKSLMTESERLRAMVSTINAHFTAREIIRPMWSIAHRLGFTGGGAGEYGAGIGHFVGLQPDTSRNATSWDLVELDSTTARLLQKLYPRARVQGVSLQGAKIKPGSKRLVIGNFPFASAKDSGINDKRFPGWSLHNYFFGRAVESLEPGGIVVAITSDSTMDSPASLKARQWLSERADLVAAIRLPNNAFKANAGTEVTTDIVILRKKDGSAFVGEPWVTTGEHINERGDGVTINEYFVRNPDMMLGRMGKEGTMYRGESNALVARPGQDTMALLESAIARLPEGIMSAVRQDEPLAPTAAGEAYKAPEFSFQEKDGKVYQVVDGMLQPPSWEGSTLAKKRGSVAKGYIALRGKLRQIVEAMLDETSTDAQIKVLQAELGKLYDAHIKKHGRLNRNHGFLSDDVDYPRVLALEKEIDVVGSDGLKRVDYDKMPIFAERTIRPPKFPTEAGSLDDAAAISRSYKGRVDIEHMAELLGESKESVTAQALAKGLIFRDPDTSMLVESMDYLSGNVRAKLKVAEAAAQDFPEYAPNVEALRAVQPPVRPFERIDIKMGATWVPPKVYERYVGSLLGGTTPEGSMSYVPSTGNWVFSWPSWVRYSNANENSGTDRVVATDLIEAIMNLRPVVVYDQVDKDTRVKNAEATNVANAKMQEIKNGFVAWVKGEGTVDLHPELETIYNEQVNNHVLPKYEAPTFKWYPGMAENAKIVPRPAQKSVVSRIVQGKSVLLAHSVGTGKTLIQSVAAMELRRLGLARKPMIVVQNATVTQFARNFMAFYPTARILVPDEKQRTAKERNKVMTMIATGDWDAVIVPQSFFNMLPDDPARQEKVINAEIDELLENKRQAAEEEGEKSPKVKDIAKAIQRLEERLGKLTDRAQDKEAFTFEQLGVDALFIDEAHAYKKNMFQTKMENIKGLDKSSSQRAFSAFMKIRYVQERSGGRNVVLATGTPITNTLAEAWNMIRFVRPDLLAEYGISKFDEFATLFTDTEVSQEETAGGRYKEVTTFSKYANLGAFRTLFRLAADVVTQREAGVEGLPTMKGGGPIMLDLEKSANLEAYIKTLDDELQAFDQMSGKEKRENSHIPLVVFGKARKASLDLRLVDSRMPNDPQSKTNRGVKEIFARWKASKANSGTQMVFADLYRSGDDLFNAFRYMRDELVKLGVPAGEIAITEDFTTEKKRADTFAAFKEGKVRILFGTSESMGTGVDVPDHMVAIHHMDAPHRPADIEQRNGRGIRKGNMNPEVEILAYGVRGTLDATLYSRLARKQDFIMSVLGSEWDDNVTEVSDEALDKMDYREMSANFSGNKLALERFAVSSDVKRLEAMRGSHIAKVRRALDSIRIGKAQADAIQRSIEKLGATKQAADAALASGQIKVNGRVLEGEGVVAQLEAVMNPHMEVAKKLRDGQVGDYRNSIPVDFSFGGMEFEIGVHIPVVGTGAPVADPERAEFTYKGKESSGASGLYGSVSSGRGLLTSLKYRLGGVEKLIESEQSHLRQVQQNVESDAKFSNSKFPYEAELTEKKRRLAELEAMMRAADSPMRDEDGDATPPPGGDISAGAPDFEQDMPGYVRPGDNGPNGPDPNPDDAAFSMVNLDMPELVAIMEDLAGGRHVRVRQRLGRSLGRFTAREGDPNSGNITVRADLFRVVPRAERQRIQREAQAQVRDGLANGSIRPQDANRALADLLRTMMTEARAEFLPKNQPDAMKVLVHELGHHVDFLDEGTLGRGNVLGHAAALKDYLKKVLPLEPGAENITDSDRDRLRRAAAKAAGTKPADAAPDADKLAWQTAYNREYASQLDTFMDEKGLVSRGRIMGELVPLFQWWNGRKNVDYYLTPEESYAEAFSVLLNNPIAFARRAPLSWQLFTNYMQARPKVLATFNEWFDRVRAGTSKADAAFRLRQNMAVAEDVTNDERLRSLESMPWAPWDSFIFHVDRIFGPVYRRANQVAKKDPAMAARVRDQIGDYRYRGAMQEAYALDVQADVVKALHDAGIEWATFAEYVFHHRVAFEPQSQDMANPGGWNAPSSRARIDEIKAGLGDKAAVLETARRRFREQYKGHVLEEMDGVWSEGQLDEMLDREYYATFAAVRGGQREEVGQGIENFLSGQYGSAVSARLYRRVGNLGKIRDPAAATFAKGASLISFAKREKAKAATVDLLNEHFRDQIVPAKKEHNGTRSTFVEQNNKNVGTLYLVRDGKLEAWYVPSAIAKSFDQAASIENNILLSTMGKGMGIFKGMLTGANPFFWPVALTRDIFDFVRKMPGRPSLFFGKKALLTKYMGPAMRDAWHLVHGAPTETGKRALRMGVVVPMGTSMGEAVAGEGAALEKEILRYTTTTAMYRQKMTRVEGEIDGLFRALGRAFRGALKMGTIFERSVKIAGLRYLDDHGKGMTEAEKKHIIRTLAGSPDFLDKGASNLLLDVGFQLFYNPWKQGWRSELDAATRSPADYAIQNFKYAVLPAILLHGLAKGWLVDLLGGDDDDREQVRRMMTRISEYTRKNYIAIPLGWADDRKDKVLTLKLPMSDAQKMVFSVASKLLEADPAGAGAVGIEMMAGTLMGDSGTPWAKIIKANYAHYMQGRNPIDVRTQRPILDADVHQARRYSFEDDADMFFWSWNTSGLGSIVHRFRPGRDPAAARTPKGMVERSLAWPGLSVALGRWLAVESHGVEEQAVKMAAPEEERRAHVRRQVDRFLTKEQLTDAERAALRADPYAGEYLKRRRSQLDRRGDTALGRALERAPAYARPSLRDALE